MFDNEFRRYTYLYCGKLTAKKPRGTEFRVTQHLIISYTNEGIYYLPLRCPDKGLKGTVVNQKCLSLIGKSLKIWLAIPLSQKLTYISLQKHSFGVQFRFALHNTLYCTACSGWLIVNPVLEMNRSLYWTECSPQTVMC